MQLFQPLTVLRPNTTHYDVDIGPVMLVSDRSVTQLYSCLQYAQNDWYYEDYYSIVQAAEAPADPSLFPRGPPPPKSDNNLINGKGNANCSQVPSKYTCVPDAGLSKFVFQKGKTHRLRLINAGAEALQRFTIDNHEMTVIANDFVPVKPYQTNMVTLGVGQRTDVLVTANNNDTAPVWMRSDISTHCSTPSKPNALAVIYFNDTNGTNGTNTTVKPTSTPTVYDDSHCGNVSRAKEPRRQHHH